MKHTLNDILYEDTLHIYVFFRWKPEDVQIGDEIVFESGKSLTVEGIIDKIINEQVWDRGKYYERVRLVDTSKNVTVFVSDFIFNDVINRLTSFFEKPNTYDSIQILHTGNDKPVIIELLDRNVAVALAPIVEDDENE